MVGESSQRWTKQHKKKMLPKSIEGIRRTLTHSGTAGATMATCRLASPSWGADLDRSASRVRSSSTQKQPMIAHSKVTTHARVKVDTYSAFNLVGPRDTG